MSKAVKNAEAINKYGTFSNGYQPKGVIRYVDGKAIDYGKVSKTGKKTKVKNAKGKIVDQNIWKTPDGAQWIWDGQTRQYVPAFSYTSR